MNRRTRRWLSIAVLAVLAFFQASMVFAACGMDRASLAQVLAEPAEHECCDESAPPQGGDAVPMSANACLAHSTADLQASGYPVPAPVVADTVVVLFLPPDPGTAVPRFVRPLRALVPSRILLHSFLI